jgi:hypothetical protein
MEDTLARIWHDLGGRIDGPLSFRLLIQPAVAAVLAIRAGWQDAKAGRAAYFWSVLTDADARRELLREGWKAVAKVFVLAAVLDAVYQILVFRWVYPTELLIVAFMLACAPYLLIRGTANRIIADWLRPAAKTGTTRP